MWTSWKKQPNSAIIWSLVCYRIRFVVIFKKLFSLQVEVISITVLCASLKRLSFKVYSKRYPMAYLLNIRIIECVIMCLRTLGNALVQDTSVLCRIDIKNLDRYIRFLTLKKDELIAWAATSFCNYSHKRICPSITETITCFLAIKWSSCCRIRIGFLFFYQPKI